jgi:hypothetical protein
MPIATMLATVRPLPLIAIDVLASVIGMLFVLVIVVLLWLALFVVLLELLEPQPAAASATPASGTIRWRFAVMHPAWVGAGAPWRRARMLDTLWRGWTREGCPRFKTCGGPNRPALGRV